MNTRTSYSYVLLIGCLLIMSGCQPNSSPILHKAMQVEYTSIDSVFFYLQQIEHPEKLPAKERGDYYFLSYRTTLRKTGKPNDSLLHIAIRHYEQNNQSSKCYKAYIEQSASYLYRNLPDSVLLLTDKLQKELPLNDTVKIQLYGLRRATFFRKRNYVEALAMADSSRQLARKIQDTLSYFHSSQIYLNILENMKRDEQYTQEYLQLIEELKNSSNFQWLNYYALESLLNTSLKRKDFQQALQYLLLLSNQKHSRNDIPQYMLLCGEVHAALNQTDSARYYYQQAATSSSEFIAMEANSLLYKLINRKEYPEQAFYTKQKENTIRNNILRSINSEIRQREFNQIKLQNELFLSHLKQQKKELWMMGVLISILSISFIAFFFYQREKKKRLQRENLLLHRDTELREMKEKEISLRRKEAELREALFRRISFFYKLPSLHTDDIQENSVCNHKIIVTDAEWTEITSAVNDAFDNFVMRLRQAYPLLGDKEVGFCCLVKINVNIQDLSDIYCVSKAAITKRKYRIKTDKLGLTDENISLDSFLKAF